MTLFQKHEEDIGMKIANAKKDWKLGFFNNYEYVKAAN